MSLRRKRTFLGPWIVIPLKKGGSFYGLYERERKREDGAGRKGYLDGLTAYTTKPHAIPSTFNARLTFPSASGALRNASLRANAREDVEKEGDEREGCRAKIRISEETVIENDRQISFNYKQDGGKEQ